MAQSRPGLSLVVVTYDQARELPRTLRSLVPPYQRGLTGDVEVIVVDNGSPTPAAASLAGDLPASVRIHRIDDAAPSPAQAANLGLSMASGDLVGLVVDGARLASPGLLAAAQRGARCSDRAVVTAPAWHLGPDLQSKAVTSGYDQGAEDALLESCAWESDGYQLFEISTPAASSGRGLFGPMGESSSLFLHRSQWDALGGLDERFSLPGGGLVNHDLYRRACGADGAELVVLLGEGTFHQIHGGAATSGRVSRATMHAEYEQLTGRAHRPPANVPTFLGSIPPQYLPHLGSSVALALTSKGGRDITGGRMSGRHTAEVDQRGEGT